MRSLHALTLVALALVLIQIGVSAEPIIPQFAKPPGQPPAWAIVSDPTVRPMLANGTPANIFSTQLIDISGIGRPDVIACYGSSPPVPPQKEPCRVLRPQPDGSLADITRQVFGSGALPSLEAPNRILIADFNNDGRPDIFIVGTGYDAVPFNGETNVLLIANADGTFTDRSSTLPQVKGYYHSVCAADIDGDGNIDIFPNSLSQFVGSENTPSGNYLLMGRGDGTFARVDNRLPAQIASAQESYTSCAFVDLDQDGYPDLVLGTWSHNGFNDSIVLFNDGHGDFTKRPRVRLPDHAFGRGSTTILDIVALDINGDGLQDLILLGTHTGSQQGAGLQALINQGNGSFSDQTATVFGSNATRLSGLPFNVLRFADLNSDGRTDLYFANSADDSVARVWLNRGDGTFVEIPPGAMPAGLIFGINAVDFDGDGKLDLLGIAHSGEGDVRYISYLNQSPRTAPETFADMWWAGEAENGWGLSLAQHTSGFIFGAVYIYDGGGRPQWFVLPGGTWSADFRTYSGAVYIPTGSPLNNYDASRIVVNPPVGSVSFYFSSHNTATFNYTIDGVSGSKSIRREFFGPPNYRFASVADHFVPLKYDAPQQVGDLWWGGVSQNGWGINLAQQYRMLFGVWYTYGPDSSATWFVMPGGTWNGNSFTGSLYLTAGSPWLSTAYNAGQLTVSPVGTISFSFSNADNASMTYSFTAGPYAGTTQTKSIVRQPF